MPAATADSSRVDSVLIRVTRILSRAGLPEARRDAELLLGKATGYPRTFLLSHPDAPVSPSQLRWLANAVNRRRRHYPLQYILGEQEFFGRPFNVSPAVLIPRPETEVLVEEALQVLGRFAQSELEGLDLGTGSGCIAISLALEEPRVRMIAVDCSESALAVAQANQRRLRAETVLFLQSDLFDAIPPGNRFHLIVSNPPYVSPGKWREVEYSVRTFEPPTAVFAPPDGLSIYRRILENAAGYLAPGGRLLLELGYDVEDQIAGLAEIHGWVVAKRTPDLAGITRCLELAREEDEGKR